jgi:alkylation response protein AidB-like acyl-CoA dehydrogenase
VTLLEFTGLTAHQQSLLDVVAAIFPILRGNAARADRDGSLPLASIDAFRNSGLAALTLPVDLGGHGADLPTAVRVLQALGRADTATALVAAMQFHVIGGVAESGAWPGVLERLAPAIRDGALLNAAASEPELGSPSRGGRMRTTATRIGERWTLSGRKTWVTGAPALQYFIVTAAIEGTEDTGRFIVPAGTTGVRLEEHGSDFLALRGSGSDDLILDGVPLPGEALIPPGPPDEGTSRAWFWAALAAAYLGVGWASLDAIASYTSERVPTALGRPIATLPKVRQAVGQIELTLYAAQTVLHDAAARWTARPREDVLPAVAAAKSLCTNAAVAATDLAMRAAGANALKADLPLERLYRDARAGLVHPPADDTTHELIASNILP